MTVEVVANDACSDALAFTREIAGWLTEEQARVLHTRAGQLPPRSQIVEIGSYRGRSTIVLALALADGGSLVAIDSHDGDNRGPRQVHGEFERGQEDFEAFHENVRRAGVASRVRHVRARSCDALEEVDGPIDLLYIDGAHQYRAARADIRCWGERVRNGGTMFVHDGFSSLGVTAALLRETALSAGWRYNGRSGSLVEFRRDRCSRTSNLRAHAGSLPWFARNVAVKIALVTRQRWACRLLGHEGATWPF